MSKCKSVFFAVITSLSLITGNGFSQVTHSPYSSIGLGDIQDPTTAAKFGMAGLGVSNGTYYSLNISNPALLHYNRVALFSAAILGETKTIAQTGYEPYEAGSGQLNHLALAFPLISGKLSTSIQLNPYSAVNYDITYERPIEGHPTDFAFFSAKGDGGIDQLSLSVGGEIVKDFSLGIKASYLFSSIRKENSSIAAISSSSYAASLNQRLSFSDFLFGLGAAYSYSLNETSSLNIGATYDLETNISSKYYARIDQELLTGSTLFADTIANNEGTLVKLPSKLALGLSYNILNKFVIGFDYSTQNWAITNESASSNLTNRKKYIFGVEFTPDIASINNYLKKITYRVGASYTNTPYIFGDTQIADFGINFGISLPVVRFSSLDFGVQLGNRGTLSNNLIQENYFKMYFGVSFNDSRWFLRPKFN